ncbi:MAG: 2,3-bisphosphoglycerate-independent phosphoglycerate mutase, partial [Rikenellaceae bacterium]
RGSLEAASMGVDIEPAEMAMRCNLISIDEQGRIKNHSAGHISTPEAAELIEYLQQELGGDGVNFFAGVSYRHLVKVDGGNKHLECTPPHNAVGVSFADVMIKPLSAEAEATATLLNELTLCSQELLAKHPVNLKRVAEGKDPANSISMWSPGYKPSMPTFRQKYGIESGSVISAVDLIKGIGVYAGLKVIEVEGATGLFDTNYKGKTQAAIDALKGGDDFVFLHVEASDEAGHEGDEQLKIRTIENLSELVVAPIMEAAAQIEGGVTIALLPDHPTPCVTKTHSREAVPFVIYSPEVQGDSVELYDEVSAVDGFYGQIVGPEFMNVLLNK